MTEGTVPDDLAKATEGLADPSSLLEEVQRLAGLGFWHFDVPSNVVTWSSQLYRIYGVDPDQFAATYEAFIELVHPDDREMVNRTVQASLASHSAWSFDHRILRPDGQIRWVHGRGTAHVADGEVVRMVGTSLDITDRKRTERFLRDFVANASNALRTSTATIRQTVDLLPTGEVKGRVAEVIDDLVSHSQGMDDLTAALVDLSQLTAGTRSMMLEPEPVATWIQAASSAVDPAGRHIDVTCDDDLQARTSGPDLQRAIQHLLNNALEHGKPPIDVAVVEDGDEIVITVADAGSGVPDDRREDLFTPFSGVVDGAGAGLGLPIVHALVRAMGGSVNYHPTDDAPGRFVVRLKSA